MSNYFNIEDTIKEIPSASIFYIVGQGGVGKSYSCKREILTNYFDNKKKFIYVKRYTTEFVSGELNSVFSDVVEDPALIERFNDYDEEDKYHTFHVLHKGAWFCLMGEKVDGSLTELDKIGRIVALSKATQFKGGVYNDCNRIFFDEFITEDGYVGKDKETERFNKVIGTVGRKINDDLRIYMCGNADASVEMCPYLYNLGIDYERMTPNTVYKYDTIEPNGHRIADNVVFVKVANYSGETFLNAKTGYLFGTPEELSRMDGAVKTYKFIKVDYKGSFEPQYELIVETPVITENEYHKKIYVYYGTMWNEPVCVICSHREYKNLKATLYCRYDELDFRPRDYRQTYRVNVPPEEGFSGLAKLIREVDSNRFFIGNDDSSCTLYQQIRVNS